MSRAPVRLHHLARIPGPFGIDAMAEFPLAFTFVYGGIGGAVDDDIAFSIGEVGVCTLCVKQVEFSEGGTEKLVVITKDLCTIDAEFDRQIPDDDYFHCPAVMM